jgi:hypothetical protein
MLLAAKMKFPITQSCKAAPWIGMGLLSILPAAAAGAALMIAQSPAPPQIDGLEDAQWALAPTLQLGKAVPLYDMLDPQDVVPAAEDLSATVQCLWDDDNLYVMVDVTDDVPQAPYTGTWFREDTVELYLDLDRSGASGNGLLRPKVSVMLLDLHLLGLELDPGTDGGGDGEGDDFGGDHGIADLGMPIAD